MLTNVIVLLIIFYAGAVCMSAWSWSRVLAGRIRFSALRDVTGIGDRAVLHRHFGPKQPDGRYQVSLVSVLRHRRTSGLILTDLPVHCLFLLALSWAALGAGVTTAEAIALAAGAHASLVGLAAASILVRGRQALLD